MLFSTLPLLKTATIYSDVWSCSTCLDPTVPKNCTYSLPLGHTDWQSFRHNCCSPLKRMTYSALNNVALQMTGLPFNEPSRSWSHVASSFYLTFSVSLVILQFRSVLFMVMRLVMVCFDVCFFNLHRLLCIHVWKVEIAELILNKWTMPVVESKSCTFIQGLYLGPEVRLLKYFQK